MRACYETQPPMSVSAAIGTGRLEVFVRPPEMAELLGAVMGRPSRPLLCLDRPQVGGRLVSSVEYGGVRFTTVTSYPLLRLVCGRPAVARQESTQSPGADVTGAWKLSTSPPWSACGEKRS